MDDLALPTPLPTGQIQVSPQGLIITRYLAPGLSMQEFIDRPTLEAIIREFKSELQKEVDIARVVKAMPRND